MSTGRQQQPRLVSVIEPTFGRAPWAALDDLADVDVTLFGAPWDHTMALPGDHTMAFRTGARLGPRGVREQSLWFKGVWDPGEAPMLAVGGAVGRGARLADCGDVVLTPVDVEGSAASIRQVAEAIARQSFPVMIGGDHSVMFPAYAGVCAARPGARVGIVQLDAHDDLLDDDALRGRHWSATPIRRAIEHAGLDPRAVAQIGLRGFTGAAEQAYQREHGIYVAAMEDVRERGVDAVLGEALGQVLAHADAIYLTVDIDCVDPSCAPGTGTLVPGGLTSAELLHVMRRLARVEEVVAVDLVEVAPPLDPSGQTEVLAAHALCEFIDKRFVKGTSA
jgi:agmatinase